MRYRSLSRAAGVRAERATHGSGGGWTDGQTATLGTGGNRTDGQTYIQLHVAVEGLDRQLLVAVEIVGRMARRTYSYTWQWRCWTDVHTATRGRRGWTDGQTIKHGSGGSWMDGRTDKQLCMALKGGTVHLVVRGGEETDIRNVIMFIVVVG